MKWPFLEEFFGPYLPQIFSDLAATCTKGVIQEDENSVSKNFEKFKFTGTTRYQSFHFFTFLLNFDPILLNEAQNSKNQV